jgi:anti-anti-sigma factor
MALPETRVRRFDDVALVSPQGRIDHAGAAPLEAALAPLCADSAVRALVLDLADVDYVSSVGLRVLMVAARGVQERSARLAVASLTPVVAEIFAISRFDAVLDVYPDVAAALAAVAPAALPAWNASRAGTP